MAVAAPLAALPLLPLMEETVAAVAAVGALEAFTSAPSAATVASLTLSLEPAPTAATLASAGVPLAQAQNACPALQEASAPVGSEPGQCQATGRPWRAQALCRPAFTLPLSAVRAGPMQQGQASAALVTLELHAPPVPAATTPSETSPAGSAPP